MRKKESMKTAAAKMPERNRNKSRRVKCRVLYTAKRKRPTFHYAEVFRAIKAILHKHAGRYLAALFARIFLWKQNQNKKSSLLTIAFH